MPITHITLNNIRVYEYAELSPHPRTNVIVGDNASGKSSVLEALYILSNSRSFRTKNLEHVCRHGEQSLQIAATHTDKYQSDQTTLAVLIEQNRRTYRINAKRTVRQSDLATLFRTVIISPDSHYQFQASTRERRAILDWLLFHVKPSFHETWLKFRRSLEQRNSLLRRHASIKTLDAWDQQFCEISGEISVLRQWALSELLPCFKEICARFLGHQINIDVRYSYGWDESHSLESLLKQNRSRDMSTGTTSCGPHRGDIEILVNGCSAKNEASHGQFKLIHTAMRMAQAELVRQMADKECCLLIDDIAAELDWKHRGAVLREISNLQSQVFITATNTSELGNEIDPDSYTFHVEHNSIKLKNLFSNNKLHVNI